tara:strand:+ start:3624 stop:3833 length:210 start_codon:yes stop_codon:yes gene_type:complete
MNSFYTVLLPSAAIGLFVGLAVHAATIINNIEHLNPELAIYDSRSSCIHAERSDCELKYIKAYVHKGGE